ncbi:MAG: ribosome maturation factor RimP [Actinomycetota bacterium]|nr:ribosome maturation factor RimP [Actinomycetota bacterium]
MKALEIVDRVKAVVESELESRGLEIVDLEYKREPVGQVLRFYIDRPEGINLDTCVAASEVINRLLDGSDVVKSAYTLEVSSPGIERRLTKPAHFIRFIGSKAIVKMNVARDGRKRFKGVLVKADDNGFSLETGDGVVDFEYNQVARANLVFAD